jgi:tmRNA-binding protein
MAGSTKLTDKEKQNGKRKLLIPSEEIQELMEPISEEEFTRLVKKATQPSLQPDLATR